MRADLEKKREQNRERVARHRQKRQAEAIIAAADLEEPPERDDLLRILGRKAREGNVPAIKLLLEEYRRDGNTDEAPEQRSVIDELAARRSA